MFRQEEAFCTDWQDKTLEAMQRRRFENTVAQLPPLGAVRLSALPYGTLKRRLERCWQDVPRKPLRSQVEAQVLKAVLGSIKRQADCLSQEEHDLVERALILGGTAQITDMAELEAAQALSLRLWGNLGLVSGRPYIELEPAVAEHAARAFAREEHEEIRQRFAIFSQKVTAALYCVGVLDDRYPQQIILRDVLGSCDGDELSRQLARRYLWASYDCFDYREGVMLVHAALAEPRQVLSGIRRKTGFCLTDNAQTFAADILPEEVPLERALECAIKGALRAGIHEHDVSKTLRFLCKQGAPLEAMERVLQSSLIVCLSEAMRGALANMFYFTPKWVQCSGLKSVQ